MRIKENAFLNDRYYIEAPDDRSVEFIDAVEDMSLPHPESDFYDFDNIYIATVEQIRAMIEDYGIDPRVYESFDEEEGPSDEIYDIYSLAFDAEPLDECVYVGQACGTGEISDFVPENVRGVVDIHSKDKKGLAESEVKSENPCNYFYGNAEKNIEYSKVNPNNMKINKRLPESELNTENHNGFRYPHEKDNIEFNERNPKDNKKLPESKSFVIPRNLRESRALPGGMLNSEEKTAYEDFLRDRHQKQDKVKAKEFGKNKLGLYDDDCGENGWHNWDGTKIERKIKNR